MRNFPKKKKKVIKTDGFKFGGGGGGDASLILLLLYTLIRMAGTLPMTEQVSLVKYNLVETSDL
jgi:hypothetical protein